MKLPNFLIEDDLELVPPTENNISHYIRARMEDNYSAQSQAVLDQLLKESIPLVGDISTTTVEDGRKYQGEFVQVSGIFLYNKNIVVTKGTINFRNKEYLGLEFLANQSINVQDEMEKFISTVCEGNQSKINQYKLTQVKKVGNIF